MDEFNFSIDDKDITITGPDENLSIKVDFDDVNHPEVIKAVKKLVKLLNQHWK